MITRWDLNELNHSEDELYHHGVMGMRWGHRKQQPTSGVSNSRAARRKRIIRNVAIGAGAAAAVGAGLYIAKKKGLIGRSKVGTVSNASLGKMTNRHTVGVGSKYLRTPTLNGYFNGQGKALSVGKKPISSLNRSGSGQVKRLLQRNGNVKVSKVSSQINGKAFNRIGKSYTGVHTPTLNNRIAIPKDKIRRASNTMFGDKATIPVTSRSWGTKFVGGSTDGKALGKTWIKSAYNWRKLPNEWR